MKTMFRFTFCLAVGMSLAAFKTQAATSERLMNFTLSGFFQNVDNFGNETAIPFRVTTRDILEEISIDSGLNLYNGVLVVVDSVENPDAITQIYARKSFNDIGSELNVTDLFTIGPGEDVRTARFNGNVLRNATFYAIDQFEFSTLAEAEGLVLTFQGFSKETQRVNVRRIGTDTFSVTSPNLRSDGNGELRSGNGFIGPIKGSIRIGAPKFFP